MTRAIDVERPVTRWFAFSGIVAAVDAWHTRIFSRSRRQDWNLGLLAALVGIIILVTGAEVRVGTWDSWTAEIPARAWAITLIVLAAARAIALRVNGWAQSGWSAGVRGLAAGVAVIFWATVGISEMLPIVRGQSTNALSAVLLLWIAWCEAGCTSRAFTDVLHIRAASRLAAVVPHEPR